MQVLGKGKEGWVKFDVVQQIAFGEQEQEQKSGIVKEETGRAGTRSDEGRDEETGR